MKECRKCGAVVTAGKLDGFCASCVPRTTVEDFARRAAQGGWGEASVLAQYYLDRIAALNALIMALRADGDRLRAVLAECPFGVQEGTEELRLTRWHAATEAQLCEWVRRAHDARKPSNKVALATIATDGGVCTAAEVGATPGDDDDDPYEGSWREAADNEGARIAAEDRAEGDE